MIEYDPKILRSMFGRPVNPQIPVSLDEISMKAQMQAGKLSISGVQPKLSVKLVGSELKAVQSDGRYILKPQTQDFPELPQNEYLCMQMGRRFGLDTAENLLIELSDGSYAYITRRFDRISRAGKTEKLPCEDMQQLLGGPDKYQGSHEQIAKAIKAHCSFPPLELQKLFEVTIFNFAIGNGDAHKKNFSFLTRDNQLY